MEHKNLNTEETANSDLGAVMRGCLLAIAEGKVNCEMDYPNFRKVKVEIIGVDLTNIVWKPIHVRILEKGLKQEIETLEDGNGFGGYDYEPPQVMVKKQIPFTDAWVDVRWLSNYA